MLILIVWILGIDIVCHTVGNERICADTGQAPVRRQTEKAGNRESAGGPALDAFASTREIRTMCSNLMDGYLEIVDRRGATMPREICGYDDEACDSDREMEIFCLAMQEVMGEEYERVIDRGVELQKLFCEKFQHVPSKPPKHPDLAKKWHELAGLVREFHAWYSMAKRHGDLSEQERFRVLRMEIDYDRMGFSCEREQ